MQRFFTSEPPEAMLSMLGDALDLVDFGIVLLSPDLRARFINRRCVEMWDLPPTLLASAPSLRDLLEHGAASGWFAVTVTAADLSAYIDTLEAEVRAGSIPPTMMDLTDGRHLLFRCIACGDGGRIMTYSDISNELGRKATDAVAQISAELRFNTEMLEDQGAHLASLAEASEENAQKAEAARLLLVDEIAGRHQLEMKLRLLATTDGLTGAFNRVELLAAAQREMEAVAGTEKRLVVLMLDVDHFKAINDGFGHAGGDRALQQLVATLLAGIRQVDLLGRLGGEEFAIVLPDTPFSPAERVAERLRARVEAVPITFGDRLIPMTVSIGLAIQLATDHSIEQVIARADDALYRAKRGGRNRVVTEQSPVAANITAIG